MTAQLALALGPRPAAVLSVTRLLWEAAGRPTNTTDLTGRVDAVRVPGARCWWCGQPAPDGWARPRSILPDTFPYPLETAIPESPHLCLPCGWTLCDRVALPGGIAAEKIRTRATKGGRLIVSVRGAPAQRWLVLELADGTVGLWTPAENTAAEVPWTEAVEALRAAPVDVGPCRYVEAVPLDALAPEATEKFRAYHHWCSGGQWWPFTDSNRMELRARLLAGPRSPWCCVIGDGKGHSALQAQLLDAVDAVYLHRQRAVVRCTPADLTRWLEAVEALLVAGATDDEIARGRYAPRGLELLVAVRTHDPVVAEIRGGPTLALVLYLRRNRKELGC